MPQKQNKSSKKRQQKSQIQKQKKNQKKLHWAVDLCSKVQFVLTIPALFLLGFMIVIGVIALFFRIVNFRKESISGIVGLIFGIAFLSFLFGLTIWVYLHHPSYMCAMLIANLIFSFSSALYSIVSKN